MVAIVVVAVPSVGHIEASTIPMPVSLTDPNSDAAGDFRDDHRFVAGIQRTGKCRHRQERNKKKGKHSILHGILLGWDARRPDARQNTRLVFLKSV
ncbi:MAG: hypothetical protein ACLPX7_18530 [Xanthobacteraceae bacterium]